MSGVSYSIFQRVVRKLARFRMGAALQAYVDGMTADSPLRGLPTKVIGDASADPTEFFSHYEAYGYWIAKKLAEGGSKYRILDIGSPKSQNAILSATHEVTAVVLADCKDQISAIRYVLHDVSDKLPFEAHSFDILTSTVALPLVGLGRYGDKVDPNSLPNLVKEFDRVMARDARLLISMPMGPNLLAFNNSWFFDLETLNRIFSGWKLTDCLVDNWSSPRSTSRAANGKRFTDPAAGEHIASGDYRVVFCEYSRSST